MGCDEMCNPITNHPTFPTLCTQKVSDVIVNPKVLLQHVLPCERFVTLITAVALHTYVIKQTHIHVKLKKNNNLPYNFDMGSVFLNLKKFELSNI